MSLYQRYRPRKFSDIYGNENMLMTLESVVLSQDLPRVYLLYGDTGCGKTTLARIIGKTLKVHEQDFKEINAADFRGIDTIRDISDDCMYGTLSGGKYKMWVLDECHQLVHTAQNALLKLLEDTPESVIFVLCTTHPEKLLPTIRGRCSQFEVKTLDDRTMFRLLKSVVDSEGDKLSKECYLRIIDVAQGHPRNALQYLEQLLLSEPLKRESVVLKDVDIEKQVIDLCRLLIKGAQWQVTCKTLSSLKNEDSEKIRRTVMSYFATVLSKGKNDIAFNVISSLISVGYYSGYPGIVAALYEVFGENEGIQA